VNNERLEDQDSMESFQAPVSENLTTYLQGVEDKLGQLEEKHAKLVNFVTEAGPGSKSRVILDAAKGEEHSALQTDMDKTLADLDQSYDKALAEFAG
jgi:hypothetical protein